MAAASFFATALLALTSTLSLVLRPIDAFAPSTSFVRPTATTSKHSNPLQLSSSDSTTNKQPHILILGGGFGGINTALTLPTLPWSNCRPKITLVDKSERFVFLPLLYELCVEDASIDEVAPTFKSLLRDGELPSLNGNLFSLITAPVEDGGANDVSFVHATVEGIDVKNQQVVVSQSSNGSLETIDYDALVIATGAEISLDGIPGASSHALPFYTVEQCLELKRRLALLDSYLDEKQRSGDDTPVNLVVVGGGYSGVELALNLVDRLSYSDCDVQVSLVHRGKQVLEYATEYNRQVGIDRLKSAGVNVMTSTSVVEVAPLEGDADSTARSFMERQQCTVTLRTLDNITDSDSQDVTTSLDTNLLLWTAGATPTSTINKGIRNSILPRDAMGRIITSPTLNVPEYPNVFAIGDCSRPKKTPYPGTAQVAIQQATVAAWNVYATLASESNEGLVSRGKEPLKLPPFTYLNLGEMMTLGRNDATISTLGGIELSGPGASWLRRLVYAVRMPTDRQRLSAAVDGTVRKLSRGALGSESRKRNKPVDWK